MNWRLMLFVFLLIFAVTSTLSYAQKNSQGSKSPQPVFITQVKKAHFEDKIEALGTLRANESVVLMATVTEPVTAINFDDGQRVKAGDILVEMMSKQESAELKAEQATVEESRRQVERLEPLVKDGAASKAILDQRKREFETAKARLEEVRSRISDRVITAPFDGVLGMRNISIGAVLQPGNKITTLDDDSLMKLDFSVPAVFLSALQIGMEIETRSNSFENRIFKGKIFSIDSQIDPITRSISVRAILPNEKRLLKPGLLMSVDILKNPRDAIILPEEAIIPIGHENYVYIIEAQNGKEIAKKRSVILGSRRPGDVEIIEGINEGERVITHGTMNISDNSEVTITGIQTGGESLPDLLRREK